MSVKERLIEYLKSKKIGQSAFEKSVDLSNGYVNNIRKSIQPDKIQRIALQYPDLNMGWLMTGEGEMLKKNEVIEEKKYNLNEIISIFIEKNEELSKKVGNYEIETKILKAEIEKLKSENEGLKISARKKPVDLVDFGLETEKKEAGIA
jgi:transcriptional regulator with XRE-family HTH domain